MEFRFDIEGEDFSKAGQASSEVKKILKQLNLPPAIIRRIAVAMYEAEVNVVAHAYKGELIAKIDSEKVFLKIVDEGPGIEDIEKAMVEGYSTASAKVRQMGFGAGMGLANISKNSDNLKIHSELGIGTTVEITTYLNPND